MKTYIRNEQTGNVYEFMPEKKLDTAAAIISVLYLLFMLAFFFWQLFDIWVKKYTLLRLSGYESIEPLSSPCFQLAVYTFIGGGLGGIVNGIRSSLYWHCERIAFGRQFVWKYITAPWVGATLALFVYALIRGGIGVFGAVITTNGISIREILSFFAVGALAGYGSRDVFIWLDAQVSRLFKVASAAKVPILIGKTKEEAQNILKTANLELGEVSEEPHEEEAKVGTVIKQKPLPGLRIAAGESVDITIAVKK